METKLRFESNLEYYKTPWEDPNKPKFNRAKHNVTCANNRKKRKKRK